MGLGRMVVSSPSRVPRPPARITAFIALPFMIVEDESEPAPTEEPCPAICVYQYDMVLIHELSRRIVVYSRRTSGKLAASRTGLLAVVHIKDQWIQLFYYIFWQLREWGAEQTPGDGWRCNAFERLE